MVDEAKILHRESTLVNILGRMADQLQRQDQMLEDIAKRQIELAKVVESNELHQDTRQTKAETAIGKLQESFTRYRSDMLSLVNEQDTINKNIASLNSLINNAIYTLEKTNQAFASLDEHIKAQEKIAHDHYAHSLKQAEILPKLISDSNRSVTKLHMDTEKNLGKMHKETQRQLEKLQQETTRRLLVLGDMESAMKTLLIRTEPPEKKSFGFVRLFRRVSIFCRSKLSRILKILRKRER